MNISNNNIPLPPKGYKPTDEEPYMNSTMLAYFAKRLLDWKEELIQESHNIHNSIKESTEIVSDYTDEGLTEELRKTEYSIVHKDLVLMEQIDKAIERINNGSYGFCEKTNQEIGIKRLDAWPIATLTTDAQQQIEDEQMLFRGNSFR